MKCGAVVCALLAALVLPVSATDTAEEGHGHIVWASTYGDGRLNLWSIEPDKTGRSRVTTSFDAAYFPSISPDGSTVAFASMDTGVWSIYLVSVDGTGLTQCTTFSSAVPDWSPDGLRLVFNSDHDDEPKDTPDLWGMDLDGTNLVEYIDQPASADFNGQWSPDGQQILFVSDRDGNYELYVLEMDGSGLTRLTSHPASDYNPCWSPDGSKIAFASDRGGSLDIYVMNSDGTDVVRLTTSVAYDRAPDWSPSGREIVFESNRSGHSDLWIMASDGSGLVQLTDDEAVDMYPDWR